MVNTLQANRIDQLELKPEKAFKILFVTPRYFPFIGGVENHVYQVARRLASAGADVTVLSTDPGKRLPVQEDHEGVTIRRVPAWPEKADYYYAPGIWDVVRNGPWDILHLQSYHTLVAPAAMSAAWRAKIPYVVTFHGGGHSSRLRNVMRSAQMRMMRPLFAHASRLVATAKFEVSLYCRQLHLPQEKFVYIPNGADIGSPAPKRAGGPAEPLIVSVGRLEQYKGHQRILAAMPHILSKRPDAHLWIAGEGPYQAELERLANRLGVSSQVTIRSIPAAQRQEMVSELSKAALMVLMSEFETHPMSVLEAARLGLPVLVADTSGLSELAEQGIAKAIALESAPEQVAAAVLEQLERPMTPAKVELSTWDRCAADLFTLYKEIITDGGVNRSL
ncbi:MAG: glycosyltransferase family 4 protein [Omnitrophica WOR_2 bacterium]